MTQIARCKACGQQMIGTSCKAGRDQWLIPKGEGWEDTRRNWDRDPWPCHDCGCPPNGFHHLGCAIERCPHCGEQAITCDHFDQRLKDAGYQPPRNLNN